MSESTRPFDIVLLGASGFTGRLVAEYLLKNYGIDQDIKWAMAGRNLEKLKGIRTQLGNENVPLLQADSLDAAALDALTQQTKVLCTTVGPYAKYGSEAVASCIRSHTHYCDLTGEVQWIRRMIDAHHTAAQAKKLKIVHCCGFDSIPSDMGVFFLQQQAMEKHGSYCTQIKTGLKAASGGASGGTVASLMNVMEEARADRTIFKLLANPYSLNPADAQEGADKADLRSVIYDKHFASWIAPFVMAGINTRVVRRSHALSAFPYGKEFRYDEVQLMGKGFTGRTRGIFLAGSLGLVMTAKPGSIRHKLISRMLPKPGEGPSKEAREKGFWIYDQIGILADGQLIKGRVKGDRDPGYGSTSKMLAEAAICLAKDDLSDTFGVITPATAMGESLLQRLQKNAGLTFTVKD